MNLNFLRYLSFNKLSQNSLFVVLDVAAIYLSINFLMTGGSIILKNGGKRKKVNILN